MASALDITKPEEGSPTTASVRNNFAAIKNSLEALEAREHVSKFNIVGNLADAPAVGTSKWYPEKGIVISRVYFSLGTSGTTTALDVLKNGVSIFDADKPTCSPGLYKSSVVAPATAIVETGDYLTVNVVSPSGSDAVLCIVYS